METKKPGHLQASGTSPPTAIMAAFAKAGGRLPTRVIVRRAPGAPKTATFLLSDVSQLFLTTRLPGQGFVEAKDNSGDAYRWADKTFVAGYVWCNKMVTGSLDHSCTHPVGQAHCIKVCILPSDNDPETYRKLEQEISWRWHRSNVRHGHNKAADAANPGMEAAL